MTPRWYKKTQNSKDAVLSVNDPMIRKFLVKNIPLVDIYSEASETHMDPGWISHLLAGLAVHELCII